MSPSTTSAPPLPVQTAPGKPPLLPVQAGGRAAEWTAAHREALRQAVPSTARSWSAGSGCAASRGR